MSIRPSNEPNSENSSLGSAIDSYAHLLSHPNPSNPQNLMTIANQIVELDKLAHTVAQAVSSTMKTVAADLETILKKPLSVSGMKDVSILVAAEHYLKNPETAEFQPLVEELCKNSFALELMRTELTLLAGSVKKL